MTIMEMLNMLSMVNGEEGDGDEARVCVRQISPPGVVYQTSAGQVYTKREEMMLLLVMMMTEILMAMMMTMMTNPLEYICSQRRDRLCGCLAKNEGKQELSKVLVHLWLIWCTFEREQQTCNQLEEEVLEMVVQQQVQVQKFSEEELVYFSASVSRQNGIRQH